MVSHILKNNRSRSTFKGQNRNFENAIKGNSQNFILIESSTVGEKVFGDILPFYNNRRDVDVVTFSAEGAESVVFASRVFVVCLLSFFSEIVNNATYQSYLLTLNFYDIVSGMPSGFEVFKKKVEDLIATILDPDTRSLWWLEKKIDFRFFLVELEKMVNDFYRVVKRFYLACLVGSFLIVLTLVNLNSNVAEKNFFYNFVDNYTYNSAVPVVHSSGQADTHAVSISPEVRETGSALALFTTHKTLPGENLKEISILYGVTPETIAYNNGVELSQSEVSQVVFEEGQELKIPKTDGYLFEINENTAKIAEVYRIFKSTGVTQEELAAINNEDYIPESGVFKVGGKILIPVDDFQSVKKAEQEEERRLQRIEELKKQREVLVKLKSSDNNIQNEELFVDSGAVFSETDFIFPTKGRVERCTAGHGYPACDVSSPIGTPIVAAKSGTVSKIRTGCVDNVRSFCNSGFGNYIEITHKNNQKTLYAHLTTVTVGIGQEVNQGEVVGLMGNSGNSTGPHLHFEILIGGSRVPPERYLPFSMGRYI
jgi:murein DD-endopeptidase MepM/ murein hydrolase activator NlpD